MRVKRPRSSASKARNNGRAMRRTKATAMEDGEHLPTDPSLMTERQQLAFLLRKTAESDDSSDHSDGASESSVGRARRSPSRVTRSMTSCKQKLQRLLREGGSNVLADAVTLLHKQGLVIYRGRGRPPKNAIKLSPENNAMIDQLVEATQLTSAISAPTSPSMKTAPRAFKVEPIDCQESSEDSSSSDSSRKKRCPSSEKASPTSASDVGHMSVFSAISTHDAVEVFWSPECALCSSSYGARLNACDPLFLCAACDRKYPTQRALGIV
ncbi:TPA: hypothetical protein N0F65_003989 [Lagenidium giganteum]|uniref:Uncharacterized protein n=1 Tax=Lagenidium giganteum TaxID=4803 RepID=A0AAV2YZJ5_9STRA|nr:TPA: hypothetical protein N0F65_003989 [Lagenidium giganteum]